MRRERIPSHRRGALVVRPDEHATRWALAIAEQPVVAGEVAGPTQTAHPRAVAAAIVALGWADELVLETDRASVVVARSVTRPTRRWRRTAALTCIERPERSTSELRRAAAVLDWQTWDGELGQVPARLDGEGLVVATDGSVDPASGRAVWSWYVSEECQGAGLLEQASSTYAELKAIHDVLSRVTRTRRGRGTTVLTDCQGVVFALGFLPDGRRRHSPVPQATDPVEEALREATRRLVRETGAQVRWVRGHAGHALNSRADQRARAILRSRERYLVAVA